VLLCPFGFGKVTGKFTVYNLSTCRIPPNSLKPEKAKDPATCTCPSEISMNEFTHIIREQWNILITLLLVNSNVASTVNGRTNGWGLR